MKVSRAGAGWERVGGGEEIGVGVLGVGELDAGDFNLGVGAF